MKTPLIPITIQSIYKDKQGNAVMLPSRMAKCTPDMFHAIQGIMKSLVAKDGQLVLSDLFRSYDMQLQAHLDYVTGKKKAFSPAPGGGMHESGRAFDLDLSKINISLAEFWEIAKSHGITPIIAQPKTSISEAWHFDCRGSHGLVYEYYANGKATNMKPYTAMAASSILSIGEKVDQFAGRLNEASIQAGIIRLGGSPGNIDGSIGPRTKQELLQLNISFTNASDTLEHIENLLQLKYPVEFDVN